MKYLPLLWAGLWRKPVRTVFTLLSLIVAFLLFGMLEGISAGFDAIVAVAKLDRMYTDPRFGVPLPISYLAQVESIPGVRVVAPRTGLFGYYQEPKNGLGIIMTDERFLTVRDELHADKEAVETWRKTRDGLLVGVGAAKRLSIKVGETIGVRSANMVKTDGSRDFSFQIVGLLEDETNPGDTSYMLGHFEYGNELRTAGKDELDRILIRIDDATKDTQIARDIDKLFANSASPTRTVTDRASNQSAAASFGDIAFFVNAIVGAVLFMILFITTNTMMQAFRERIPEFAVLKTIGFGDDVVAGLVIGEALLQCLLGAGIGLLLAKALMPLLRGKLPLPGTILTTTWTVALIGLAVAVIVAVISGLLPAWRARQLNVINALLVR